MYSSSERVLEILLLISKSKGYTSKEISRKIPNASIKTIKRDIKRLKKFGFVIYDPRTKKNLLNYELFKNNGRDEV